MTGQAEAPKVPGAPEAVDVVGLADPVGRPEDDLSSLPVWFLRSAPMLDHHNTGTGCFVDLFHTSPFAMAADPEAHASELAFDQRSA